MKSLMLGIATASLLTGGIALAQTTQGTRPGETTPAPATPAAPPTSGGTGSSARTMPQDSNAAAASGDTNQAVATTSANAPAPAKGANSFTMGEAKSRIEKNGFANVTDLAKDGDGVWRGKGQKAGTSTNVWLDYKGNVGETN
jgi:protein CpxP